MKISLDGEWSLAYFPQPAGGAVRTPGAVVASGTVPARVPGNCELDLARAGLLPEPETGLNALEWRRFEGHQWLYTRHFNAPAVADGHRATLVFEGIDTLADIFLNGVKLGEAANMLVPHRFDATAALKAGENTLQVIIRSAFIEAESAPAALHAHQEGLADRARIRKSACSAGWDIFPRMWLSGIWRGVRLEIDGPARISDVFWVTGDYASAPDGTRRCRARALFRVEAPFGAFIDGSRVRLSVAGPDGARIASAERTLHGALNMVDMEAAGFELWWAAGAGDHPLYRATIELVSPAGECLASDCRRIGFRTVELVRHDDFGPDRPGEFRFKINGEPIYIQGTNWVPTDAIPSRQAERIVPTLELAGELGCNLVRVWGGGVYEPDFFYDWCDEHGILVWQDFMSGCAQTPQDDAFAAAVEAETRDVVLRLRNHPCLVLWAGNNENDESIGWRHMDGVPDIDPNGDRTSRETIPRVLREFDPTRPYLPSSPYFSPDVAAGRASPPERHLWGARDWYRNPYYIGSGVRFASETGWHGCPNRDSIERMMSPDAVYPWRRGAGADGPFDWNDEWRLKASNPFLDRDTGLWRRNDLMTRQAERLFGSVETDLDRFIAQSQAFQAEALKTMIEAFRSAKSKGAGGLVWWNVRDGWPQISDAVVDWYGGRKAAFEAVRLAQRPVLAFMLDDGSAWIANERLRAVVVHAVFRDRDSGRILLEGRWDAPANTSLKIGQIEYRGQGMIDIEYSENGGERMVNRKLAGEPPFDFARTMEWLGASVVPGRIVQGHGVASGKAGDKRFPGGTIAMQVPFFRELGLDLSGFHPGTLNVDCAPVRFQPGPEALLFERVKWHPEMPAETFSFAKAVLVHGGAAHPAYIYLPHPETKAEHFQPGCVAEIIAPKIAGLAYGDDVTLVTSPAQASWGRLQ